MIPENNWAPAIDRFFDRVAEIKLDSRMDAIQQKIVLALLDELATEMLYYYREAENEYKNLNELAELVLKSDFGGTNDQTRKKASWDKAMAYELPNGEVIDIMELRKKWRKRHDDLGAILKSIQEKQARLVIFCSLNKLDMSLH